MEIDPPQLTSLAETQQEADRIISSILTCIERGEGKGKCHVFLDHSNTCECGEKNLNRERMK
jgi:hypothetical protein